MGDCSRTWRWQVPLLATAVLASPFWLTSAGAENDGLMDVNGPKARASHAASPVEVAMADTVPTAAVDPNEPQPLRVRQKPVAAAQAPSMAPMQQVDLDTEVRPHDARREPAGAAAATTPEPLPVDDGASKARRRGRERTYDDVAPILAPAPVEPPIADTADAPPPPVAPPTRAPLRDTGPQFVKDGSRGDRGMNGSGAMVREYRRTIDPRSYRSGDPNTSRLVANYSDQIDVPAGQAVIVRLNSPAERVAIADPEVADVVLVNPREILINGRGRRHQAQGGETVIEEAQTSLVVWDKQGRSDLRELFVNRSRTEQVELRVTMAEFNRTALENQGYDFQVFQNKFFVTSQLAKLASANQLNLSWLSPITGGAVQSNQNLSVNNDRVTFSVVDFNDNFAAFVEMLQREGLAKVLARPSVITRSGEEAHFKAGGEVPIPLVTNNQSAVQFKEFGAIVTFTPTFQSDGSIDLRVATELSEPDSTVSGAVIGGFVVPGFKSRNAQTRVRLHDGQSLLIAGLLRDEESEDERKVPYLGDVPYLGAIFRNTNFIHKKTELVVLVQPRVVTRNRDDGDIRLPIAHEPLTPSNTRTRATPNPITRPRINGPTAYQGTEHAGDLPEPGEFMNREF